MVVLSASANFSSSATVTLRRPRSTSDTVTRLHDMLSEYIRRAKSAWSMPRIWRKARTLPATVSLIVLSISS